MRSNATRSVSRAKEISRDRQNDLDALAKMKEIERSRLKDLKSVRVDSRTVITSTSRRLEELTDAWETENPFAANRSVRISEQRDQFRRIFNGRDSMSRKEIVDALCSSYGINSSKAYGYILSAEEKGIISKVEEKRVSLLRLNK